MRRLFAQRRGDSGARFQTVLRVVINLFHPNRKKARAPNESSRSQVLRLRAALGLGSLQRRLGVRHRRLSWPRRSAEGHGSRRRVNALTSWPQRRPRSEGLDRGREGNSCFRVTMALAPIRGVDRLEESRVTWQEFVAKHGDSKLAHIYLEEIDDVLERPQRPFDGSIALTAK